MNNFNLKIFLIIGFALIFLNVKSQTLIMNEVSNGPAGSQEYVEFVVVSNSVTYNCSSPTPPCIDIRGWVFDDNSGYHGTSGVAAGAIRFSQNVIWSCIPLGTIILIYNDADKNPSIPATDDLSMADGNCTIIAPVSNTSLFERNTTTPGAAACSYPSTGWIAGGNWTYTALANTSDCARIVNLAGCEVFSVCYGATDNLNALIYFPASGTGTVYSFNSIDPQLQANWSSGSATTMQTPGVPNNAANASYIAQFNNSCIPITPINVTATSVNAGCSCNGSATASASGSIGGYTYTWYDANFNPIGQTSATATGLCAGVYKLIAKSSIGCSDTTSVTITSSSSTSLTVNSQTVCAGSSAILTATPSVVGGTFSWSPSGQTTSSISINPSSTTSYSVTYSLAGCNASGNGIVTVVPLPTVTVNSSTICAGQSTTLSASGATTYSWNAGAVTNTLSVTPLSNISYTITGTTSGCSNNAVANISVTPLPTITVNSSTICSGQTAILTASGANAYSWNTGSPINSISAAPLSNTNYTVTGTTSGCSNAVVSRVIVNSSPILNVNSPTICVGQSISLNVNGATTYSWNTGTTSNSINVSPSITSNYTVSGTSLGCTNSVVATVSVIPLPNIIVNSLTICSGQSATLTANGATTYTWDTGSSINPLIVSPTSNTTYTVTGTTSGCTNTGVANVSVTPLPTVTVNSSTICLGQTTSLTANGATTYLWNTGSLSSVLTVSPSSNISYTVAGTNAGCTSTAVVNVSVTPLPIVTVNSSTICAGSTATLIANGAATYFWNTGSSSNGLTVSPISNTTYTVTGTTSGCTNTAVANVSVTPLPTVTVNSSTICLGQTTTLTADGATTYSWSTGSLSSVLNVSPSSNTTYAVIGTNAGCTNTAVANVSVTPLPTVTVNSSTICLGQTTSITANGATTYLWNTGSSSNGLIVSPISNTTYTVTGTISGCTNTAVANVSVTPLPIVTVNSSTICAGSTATLIANGAATYFWNTGSLSNGLTVSPISNTSHTVTGTTSGCTNTAVANVSVKPLPTITVNSPTICLGQATSLTANGATTYSWSTGSLSNILTVSPPSNTIYTLTGTNAGCTSTTVANVSVTPLPIVTVNSSTICAGSTATLIANGASTYTWNTGSTNSSFSDNPSSTTNYSVLGELFGCVNSATASVVISPNLSLSVNTPTICYGQTTTLTSIGATTYTWSNGTIGNSIIVSPSTTTSFSVSGTNGTCSGSTITTVVVNPLPSVTVNSNTICAGQTSTLTANGATTYLWNTGSSSNGLTVSPVSNTTYTVIGTTLGCTNTAVANISITSLPMITINSSTICSGQTATITAGGATTYTWNTGSSINPLIISQTSSTIFSVIGTANGCSSTSTANIFVTPNPTISVNSVAICNGTSATLIASGASTYVWSTGSSSNTLTASPSLNTTYTVTGTASGCTNTTIATISVTPLPAVTVNSSTICSGQTTTLIANGANTYLWDSGTTGNQLTISPTTNTTYSVTGTNAGCTNTASGIVNVISSPILSVNPSTICAGETATLTVSGANSYIWNNGATTNTTVVNPTITTTYSISGTNGICNSTTTVNVIVNQLPIISATSKTICAGQSTTLTANGALLYNWNNSTFSNSLVDSPNVTTIYTVTGTSSNCSSSVTTTIVVNSIPNISFNSNKTSGCAPLCIQFTNLTTIASSTITNWSWAFDDGFSSNLKSPSRCFDNPGTYNISLLVNASNGCSKMFTNPNMINVFPNPKAEFVSSALETDILNPIIDFTNLSSNANTYEWNFGDITTSTLTNPSHTYNQEGTYSTTLTSTNQYGCKDIVIHDIVVKGIFTFYAPNTFTPNEDNVNDVFLPLGVGWDSEKYQLDIFDRWGNNCFNTKEVGKGWDGKANHGSESAQIDTYTWKVDLTDVFGVKRKYIGKVTLIR